MLVLHFIPHYVLACEKHSADLDFKSTDKWQRLRKYEIIFPTLGVCFHVAV